LLINCFFSVRSGYDAAMQALSYSDNIDPKTDEIVASRRLAAVFDLPHPPLCAIGTAFHKLLDRLPGLRP
jgi:hypothetical protein